MGSIAWRTAWAVAALLVAGVVTERAARADAPVELRAAETVVAPEPPQEPDEPEVNVEDPADEADETPADRAEELYDEGTDALDEERWDDAVSAFDEVVRVGGGRVEGALYWKAYAQAKGGRKAEAMATVVELRRRAPRSRWLDEAQALEMEIRQASGQQVAPESAADEDLKLIALNSLMAADAGKALPMLERFLAGSASRKLRDKALFVLSQSEAPQARALVADVARGRRHPDLQRTAVKYLGLFGGQESRQALSEIYAGSQDVAVKKAVLHAFMLSGDKARVVTAARAEQAPELRRAAIQQLGVMGGQDELWELYRAEPSVDVRKHILHGLFIGGAEERLSELARTEKQAELRRAVVRNLGLLGGARTGALLVSLYRDDPDAGIRREAVQGLFIQGNAEALVQLARAEKDPAMRRELVSKLSLMSSKPAQDYMMELLK